MSARPESLPAGALTLRALRALEDVAGRADCGTVELTPADRLALDVLVRSEVAERWQVRQFLEALSVPISQPLVAHSDHYLRSLIVSSSLDAWYHRAGLRREDCALLSVAARRHSLEMLDPDDHQPQPWLMCNRYRPGTREAITRLFDVHSTRAINDGPAIVHPRDPGFVVRRQDGALVLDQMSWGFPVILRGKRGQVLKPKPVNNARFDKLGAFWALWARDPEHRCLIPTSAYAEAEGPSGKMRTTWLTLKSAPVFAWAGLWSQDPDWGAVYTGVMTDNAPELAEIHDRSPVILAPEDWETWLSAPLEDLRQFDRPWPASDTMVTRTDVLWTKGGRDDAYLGTLPAVPWAMTD